MDSELADVLSEVSPYLEEAAPGLLSIPLEKRLTSYSFCAHACFLFPAIPEAMYSSRHGRSSRRSRWPSQNPKGARRSGARAQQAQSQSMPLVRQWRPYGLACKTSEFLHTRVDDVVSHAFFDLAPYTFPQPSGDLGVTPVSPTTPLTNFTMLYYPNNTVKFVTIRTNTDNIVPIGNYLVSSSSILAENNIAVGNPTSGALQSSPDFTLGTEVRCLGSALRIRVTKSPNQTMNFRYMVAEPSMTWDANVLALRNSDFATTIPVQHGKWINVFGGLETSKQGLQQPGHLGSRYLPRN